MRYLSSRCSSKADAEDLCQEVFSYCWKHFHEYDSQKASYRTWIYVVVISRYRNYCNRKKCTSDIDEFIDVLPDQKNSVEQEIFLEESREQLAQALLNLSERERAIIILHFFSHLSSVEIASKLHLTETNVRQIQKRALKKLSHYMQ